MNANDAKLTALLTAQSGSRVEDNAPNAPDHAKFDLVVEAVAGNAIGNNLMPYTLTITAMDLTAVAPAPALDPTVPAQSFDTPLWKLSGGGPDYESTQVFKITVPPTVPAGPLHDHVLQYVASLVNSNGQIASIITSEPFVLV
jgi:hypothetical protein